jgi:tetratricopeptide (TPR) repeat protein
MSPFSLRICHTKPFLFCGVFLTLFFGCGSLHAGLGSDDSWYQGSLPAAPSSPPSAAVGSGPAQTYRPYAPDPSIVAGNQMIDAAEEAYDNKNWELAISDYQQALSYEPGNSSLYSSIAYALAGEAGDFYDKGDYVTAENYYRQSLKTDPNNSRGLWGLARLQTQYGILAKNNRDFVTAEADFKLALNTKSDFNYARINLANLYNDEGIAAYNKGDLQSALKYYRQAVDMDPSNDAANHKIFQSNFSGVQEKVKDAQQDNSTVAETKKSIDHLADSISPSKSNNDLSFDDPMVVDGRQPPPDSGLKDAVASPPSDYKTTKGSMGTTISDPTLEKADASAQSGTDTLAGDQALSAGYHGKNGSDAAPADPEKAHQQASDVFDTAGQKKGSLPVVTAANVNDGYTVPPQYLKDEKIMTIQKAENKAAAKQVALEQKLKEIQGNKNNPDVDQGALAVQEVKIKDELTHNKSVIYDERRKKEERVGELKRYDLNLLNGDATKSKPADSGN